MWHKVHELWDIAVIPFVNYNFWSYGFDITYKSNSCNIQIYNSMPQSSYSMYCNPVQFILICEALSHSSQGAPLKFILKVIHSYGKILLPLNAIPISNSTKNFWGLPDLVKGIYNIKCTNQTCMCIGTFIYISFIITHNVFLCLLNRKPFLFYLKCFLYYIKS